MSGMLDLCGAEKEAEMKGNPAISCLGWAAFVAVAFGWVVLQVFM